MPMSALLGCVMRCSSLSRACSKSCVLSAHATASLVCTAAKEAPATVTAPSRFGMPSGVDAAILKMPPCSTWLSDSASTNTAPPDTICAHARSLVHHLCHNLQQQQHLVKAELIAANYIGMYNRTLTCAAALARLCTVKDVQMKK
eukprot:15467-Heterococcus_DN1.PRE.1